MPRFTLILVIAAYFLGPAQAASPKAHNVILFLGDAGGIPTLSAAGIYAHDKPQSLFIQSMPHLALAETSALDQWVTDSAAGMTAIMTGQKTNNGMLSLLPGTEERPLKTILEYAEEKGCATGVITNRQVWDATPAACYAHVSARGKMTDIFAQVFTPRFGDGVDVLIGSDRQKLFAAAEQTGLQPMAAIRQAGYAFFESPTQITSASSRVMCIYDGDDFAPQPVVDTALQVLSRNPKGYFLMIEWDMHTNHLNQGLDRAIVMDELIRHVAGRVSADTLIIYAADHSFDLRMRAGKRNAPLAPQVAATLNIPPPNQPVLAVVNSHTGEEVLITAQGPGAERLHGFISNTRIFSVMMEAYGWAESP